MNIVKIFFYISMLMILSFSCKSTENSQSYKVELTVYPSNSGTVTGNSMLKSGEKARITASPKPGYVFSNWQVAGTSNVFSTEANHEWNVNKNMSLIAIFKRAYDNSLIDIL